MNKAIAFIALIVLLALVAGAVLLSAPDNDPAPILITAAAASPGAPRATVLGRPGSAPSSGAPVSATQPAADIGPEGYGPHILSIADARDASHALQAIGWMDDCKYNSEFVLDALYQTRDQMRTAALQAMMTYQIEQMQAKMCRCQTVTPEIEALRSSLALLALQARMPGAAVAYAQATNGAPPADQLPLVSAQLESDARGGSLQALRMLARYAERFSVDPSSAATYYAAYKILEEAPEPVIGWGSPWPQVLPPAHADTADTAAARAIADRVLAEWKPAAAARQGH